MFVMATNTLGFTEVVVISTPRTSEVDLETLGMISLGDMAGPANPQNEFVVGTLVLNLEAPSTIVNRTMYSKAVDDRGRTTFIATHAMEISPEGEGAATQYSH